jgi:hypothetical protein
MQTQEEKNHSSDMSMNSKSSLLENKMRKKCRSMNISIIEDIESMKILTRINKTPTQF